MKQSKHYTLEEIGKIVLSQKENEGFSNFILDDTVEMIAIGGIPFSQEDLNNTYLFSIEKEIE